MRSSKKCHHHHVLLAAALATFVAIPRSALAEEDLSIGADLDWLRARDPEPASGTGLGIRIGQRIHVPLLVVSPEISLGYGEIASEQLARLYRGTAGLRLGVGEILRPGAFLHLGVGRLEGLENAQTADRTRTAFTWDAGGFLDITVLPFIDVGAHVAWGSLAARHGAPSYGFLMVGLQAALIL
jgi:hypothetical protein